jgi:hypothetical protein
MQASITQTQQQIERAMMARCHAPDHREVWADILPGLQSLAAMYEDPDWSIDGVRLMLDEGRAVLLVDRAEPSAFAVVRFDDYPYCAGETELFVYLVWHQGGDAIARFQPHLEMFAHLGGAQHMRFMSRRRAFLRVAEREGYRMHSIEYVKEIPHVR